MTFDKFNQAIDWNVLPNLKWMDSRRIEILSFVFLGWKWNYINILSTGGETFLLIQSFNFDRKELFNLCWKDETHKYLISVLFASKTQPKKICDAFYCLAFREKNDRDKLISLSYF